MRATLFYILVLIPGFFFGQTETPNEFRLSKSASHDLYIRFDNGIITGFENNFTTQANEKVEGFSLLQKEYKIELIRGIQLSEEQFIGLEQKETAVSHTSDKIINLRSIFEIKIQDPSNENLYQLGLELQKLKGVVYCSLISGEPIKPPTDIPPTTTNYQPQQGYIGTNPGVNMQYAWDNFQTGTGIAIRDVEYGVNVNHEEFAGGATSIAAGMTINTQASIDYTEHGTAVFGIVYGNKGAYGISGLAHGAAAMVLYPEWQQSGYNRINAVTQAIANSQIGDVIIYEMQTFGQNDNYVAAEYNSVVWDLTAAGTAAGIVIVAAAGNGNQNLDAAFYSSYMNRGDSGAIIVGAGSSNVFHNKLFFSTYGTRVNVQGWGENVYTTGYFPTNPNSFKVGDDFNQSYSTSFNGTSSATPIVASCAVVLQSYHFSLTGTYLTSIQLRAILKETGIAQGNSFAGSIGPLPNMQAAMQKIHANYLLKVKSNTKPSFTIAPNPATSLLNVIASNKFGDGATVLIYNNLGQKVISVTLNDNKQIDISNLIQGVYFVQINSKEGFSVTQKMIKK